MAIAINEALCIGCSLCVIECPEEAISARSIAVIDKDKCISCKKCIKHCPGDAIKEIQS